MVPVDDNVCDIKDETDQEMLATDRVLVVTNLETMEPKIISGTTAGSAVTSFRWLNNERLLVSRDSRAGIDSASLYTIDRDGKNTTLLIEAKAFRNKPGYQVPSLYGVYPRVPGKVMITLLNTGSRSRDLYWLDLKTKRSELANIQLQISDFDNKTLNYSNEATKLKEQCAEVADELEKVALDNQTYRFAIKIKSFRKWLGNFSFSSILPWNWGDEKINTENKDPELITSSEKKCSTSSAALISDDDLNFAFWLWFGTLAFVISVIGTFIALAGLHLQDERMHEIRNRPMKERFSRFFRNIAWIPVYINKYIWAGVKRFTKPKIIEKEVVVEKEVEKIVEKNVGEKIIYEKVEVPKEVVRKEIVYVPLPTDDEELLKKGPFKPDEKDKKK